MNPDHDFSRSPRQRQRRRETEFYCALGFGTALAIIAVLVLGWSIEGDSVRLQAGTLMLQTELQQLQPRLARVRELEARIVMQHKDLESHIAQATQRAFAPHALHALATISPTHIRLHQIVVRTDGAEIRGAAHGQRQLQDLIESLNASGLGQVLLQEMRQDPLATPPLRYSFTLTLSSSAAMISPVQPQAPAQPSNSEAAHAQRAKRT